METIATTRMSSKGQIVIPESIRKRLNLSPGAQFLVLGEGDVVILKAISAPDIHTFDELIQEAHQQAKIVGLKRSDISKAISEARSKR